MNNQVFIHRFRKRNIEEAKFKSQYGEKPGTSSSPFKASNLSQNKDLDGMWSPPTMTGKVTLFSGEDDDKLKKHLRIHSK